jgi:hypothetical protein
MYSLNAARIAAELALQSSYREDTGSRFFEHFLGITGAINELGKRAGTVG